MHVVATQHLITSCEFQSRAYITVATARWQTPKNVFGGEVTQHALVT